MTNELPGNSIDSTFSDPQLIDIIGRLSTDDAGEIRTSIEMLPDDLLEVLWKLFENPTNHLIILVMKKADNTHLMLENEYKKRECRNLPVAKFSPNGARWVVPPEEYAIVELLSREGGWMSSRRITEALGGIGRSGRPRRAQWATTRGKNLVARGVLQINDLGEFRALQNARNVIEK